MKTRIQKRHQRGVTLLEVLISVVILSVGLLGLAGLQAVSIRNNTSAYQRSVATMLAYDVIDRIRADLPDCEDYPVALVADGAGDVKNWKDGVKAALPGGDASIVIAAGTATVTIRWDDNRNAANMNLTTQTTLPTLAPSTCT